MGTSLLQSDSLGNGVNIYTSALCQAGQTFRTLLEGPRGREEGVEGCFL